MKNNKGLSTIVTTLIIILLALVAIGIIWSVVRGLADETKKGVADSTMCRDIEFAIQKVDSNASSTTSLTLKRYARGTNEEVGAKVMFYTDTGNSEVKTFGENFKPIETKTDDFDLTSLSPEEITKVEVTPFFYDDNGKETLCSSQPAVEI